MRTIISSERKWEKANKWFFNFLSVYLVVFSSFFIAIGVLLFPNDSTFAAFILIFSIPFLLLGLISKFILIQGIEGDDLIIDSSGKNPINSENISFLLKLATINITDRFILVIRLRKPLGIKRYLYFVNDPDYAVIKWCKNMNVKMINIIFEDNRE